MHAGMQGNANSTAGWGRAYFAPVPCRNTDTYQSATPHMRATMLTSLITFSKDLPASTIIMPVFIARASKATKRLVEVKYSVPVGKTDEGADAHELLTTVFRNRALFVVSFKDQIIAFELQHLPQPASTKREQPDAKHAPDVDGVTVVADVEGLWVNLVVTIDVGSDVFRTMITQFAGAECTAKLYKHILELSQQPIRDLKPLVFKEVLDLEASVAK